MTNIKISLFLPMFYSAQIQQHRALEKKDFILIPFRALNGVGAGFLEWAVTSPSEAVFECLLVFNQSGVDLESFSGAYRSRKCFG